MSKEIYLLFFINVCSAIGYSLIAPLYPSEAEKRGIKEDISGIIISMFAIANFFSTPFCPALISKFGRKRMFYVAFFLEGSGTLVYGFIYFIHDYYLFLSISIIGRIMHGIGASFSATLVYSVAASISDPDKQKITLGYMELAWCLGVAIGPICASIFYYIGGYTLPFWVCGAVIFVCIPFIYKLKLPEDEEVGETPSFLKAMMNCNVMTVTFCVVMDMMSKTFFFPTFTNHLITNFGFTIESSSIFFILNMVSYILIIQYLNAIIGKLGLKLTMVMGLIFISIGVLFLAPISILPQSYITIIIGLLILGIPAVSINVPAICDIIDELKISMKLDESSANDMASAIYNLGLNFGEAIGPTYGGYVAYYSDFSTSCVIMSIIAFIYCIFFYIYHFNNIKKELREIDKFNVMNKDLKEKFLDGEHISKLGDRIFSDNSKKNITATRIKPLNRKKAVVGRYIVDLSSVDSQNSSFYTDGDYYNKRA